MLLNTQGLVLRTTNYSETSVVAKIFTRHLGGRSYLIKGVNKAKSRTKRNLLQPLSYLELTVYDNNRRQLQYIKEMQPALHPVNCATDSIKTTLLFFMNEVLYKALPDEQPNPALFDFGVLQIEFLEECEDSLAHYPAFFLLQLAQHLGIAPLDNYSPREPHFNIKEGRFMPSPSFATEATDLRYYVSVAASKQLHLLCGMAQGEVRPVVLSLPAADRRALMDLLLQYYQYHLPEFRHFKSIEVLHQVLN